jgi:cyclopropane fatty-acyl-phospholipid synthase-like methyltransferase
MARLGWQVDAVDFIPQAIESARQRAIEAGVAHKICFYLSDVTQLGFLHAPYDFALDVGCVHGIGQTALQPYHAGLLRLLPAGALYLLFAHLNDAQTQRWLNEPDLLATFSHGFRLDRVEYGTTQVNDQPPWRSAWYWFRRVS